MIKEFEPITQGIFTLIKEWEPRLLELPGDLITQRRNTQNRSIKQILGHMVDSASNNTHRIVHLQYQSTPLIFPNYATDGNNDKWIAIQNYQDEKWADLIQLWKYAHLHIIHVISNVNPEKSDNEWVSGSKDGNISLNAMIIDFLRHFKLHLCEIEDLIKQDY